MRKETSVRAKASLFALATTLPFLVGCGPTFNYVYMAKDSRGDEKTTKFFSLGDEIHCVMEMVGGNEDTTISLDLSGSGDLQLPENEFFPRPQGEQGPVFWDIQLFLTDPVTGDKYEEGPWPPGSYNMDVYIDDSLEESLPFEVVSN
ncbi:MAG TPA: hypothetical protein ENK57_20635 [Polyangiaceae bacterium]|nr:hypothetical protein [Polyangiaceae bacterium]